MANERYYYNGPRGAVAPRGGGRTAGNSRPAQMRRATTQNRRPDPRSYRSAPQGRRMPPQGSRMAPQGSRASQPRRPANRSHAGYRQPAPGQRYAQPSRRAPRRRRGLNPALLAAIAAALVILLGGFFLLKNRGGNEERFVDNVSINGVDLSGLTKEEGYAKMAALKEKSLTATYTLTYADKSWNFTPSSFNAQLDFDDQLARAWNLGHVGDRATRRQIINDLKEMPAQLDSEISYDEKALDEFISTMAAQIDTDPVNAEVTLTEEKPVITVASQSGTKLDKAETKKNLIELITTGEGTTELPVDVVEPSISSDSMEMKVVAKFSTDVSFRGYDSRYNVRLALNYFNCFTVNPGDTVSFNDVVGPRTEEAGFRKAPEYAGNEIVQNVGGGVCQASTTLYDACIMAGMTIIERHNHNMTVTYVEPSQDAAVEYKDKDFVFRNDTPYTYYIYTNVSGETADITIYGTRPEYHYVLESIVKEEKPTDRERFEDDVDGKFCYYTDQTKLKTEGHGSCHSEGWIVSYDWNTKQEVSREQISNDAYSPGVTVYWRGVHTR